MDRMNYHYRVSSIGGNSGGYARDCSVDVAQLNRHNSDSSNNLLHHNRDFNKEETSMKKSKTLISL